MKKLSLYVWDGWNPDYSGGIAFAIAESTEQAMEMVKEKAGYDPSDWGVLTVHSLREPYVNLRSGGS